MIDFLVALIAFVFVLGVLVVVHELGHFFFAKRAGILCSEFAIGMGPQIYQKKKNETTYAIRALPIGGFVSMAGEDMNESLVKVGKRVSLNLENNLIKEIILSEKIDGMISGVVKDLDLYGKDGKEIFIELEIDNVLNRFYLDKEAFYVVSEKRKLPIAPYDRCFESKSVLARFLTLIAGPVANLLLAVIIFIIVGLASGVPNTTNEIGEITTNTANEYLQKGDIVTKIGNTVINSWSDISNGIAPFKENFDEYIPMEVLRDGEAEVVMVNVKTSIHINSIGINNVGVTDEEIDENKAKGFVIGEVPKGNNSAGKLQEGDVISGIGFENNNYTIVPAITWSSFKSLLDSNPNQKIKVQYYRDDVIGETKEIEVFTEDTLTSLEIEEYTYLIGISPTTKFDLFQGIKNGFILTWDNATIIFRTLGMIINPSSQLGVSDLSGPVGIFGLVQSYLDAGLVAFLSFIGLLSINLFVVNLLPFPGLDGGRLIFVIYEAITKKKVNKKVENNITFVGFILLMALMLYITFNDVLNIFK